MRRLSLSSRPEGLTPRFSHQQLLVLCSPTQHVRLPQSQQDSSRAVEPRLCARNPRLGIHAPQVRSRQAGPARRHQAQGTGSGARDCRQDDAEHERQYGLAANGPGLVRCWTFARQLCWSFNWPRTTGGTDSALGFDDSSPPSSSSSLSYDLPPFLAPTPRFSAYALGASALATSRSPPQRGGGRSEGLPDPVPATRFEDRGARDAAARVGDGVVGNAGWVRGAVSRVGRDEEEAGRPHQPCRGDAWGFAADRGSSACVLWFFSSLLDPWS